MKKTLKLLTLTMIVVLLVVGCSTNDNKKVDINQEEESVEKVENKTEPLEISLSGGDWGYPSPYTHYSRGPGMFKMRLIFDSLLERGEEGLIPWLAESWDVSEAGKEYTFKIREGVKWQDGEPMTAEDVKFSFEYYAEYPPVTDDLEISENNYIEKIEVLDDHTINIQVDRPNATLLERFGTARIIPKHIWEDVDDPIKFTKPEAVIGCGPYILTDYEGEQGAYRFEAFEDYWGPKQKVDVIKFVPVSDPILSFENEEIDITGITPDILPKYESDPQYKIIQNPAYWGYKLALNMEKRPELKEKKMRQALSYAIDQEELVEKVARGAAKVGSPGYLPVEHIWYNENVKQYDFDLDKTRELLDNKSYNFTLLTSDSNSELRIAELIKINFEKAGINIEIKSVDSKSRDAAIRDGDYEIALNGYGGWGADPDILRDQYVSIDFEGTMFSGIPDYSNEKINRLCEEQLVELDKEKRKDIIFELQELIAEEIPQIPLYNTAEYSVFRPKKYDGWKHVFNHHFVTHNKISYLDVE